MDQDELLLEWYRNLHQERWERSRRTWLTISIFITGSFLLVLEAIRSRTQLGMIGFLFLMTIAICLVGASWFVEFCAIKLNDSALTSIEEIEDRWSFKEPRNRHEREEKFLWFKARKNLWHLIFVSLIFTYFVAIVLFLSTN